MSEYTKRADEFCKKFGVKFTVGEPTYKRHFADDTVERWVFPVTLTRDGRSMRVQFGQSLAAGSAEPTAYDVLSCLTKYDVGTFDDFCGEFGYDTDSRKAERTYQAVCREWASVSRVFGTDGECYEALCEIN